MKQNGRDAANELLQAMLAFGSVVQPYLSDQVDRVLDVAGLTARDLAIVEFVSQRGRTSFAEIDAHFQIERSPGTSTSRISAAVSTLFCKHGLIKKEVNPDDQRQTIVTLTENGRGLLEQVSNVRERVYKEIRTAMALEKDEATRLKAIYERGTKNFREFLTKNSNATT